MDFAGVKKLLSGIFENNTGWMLKFFFLVKQPL